MFVRVLDIPPEGMDVEIDELIPPLDPAIGEVIPVVGPSRGVLRLEPLSKKWVVRVKGTVRCSLMLCCSRCLDPFLWEAQVDVNDLCAPLPKGGMLQGELKDAFGYTHGVIDLTALYTSLLYSVLEMKPLCSPDCKGLCPSCGANRNRESCECGKPARDPRWEVLEKIKKQLVDGDVA
jgi:uncharacterized protein